MKCGQEGVRGVARSICGFLILSLDKIRKLIYSFLLPSFLLPLELVISLRLHSSYLHVKILFLIRPSLLSPMSDFLSLSLSFLSRFVQLEYLRTLIALLSAIIVIVIASARFHRLLRCVLSMIIIIYAFSICIITSSDSRLFYYPWDSRESLFASDALSRAVRQMRAHVCDRGVPFFFRDSFYYICLVLLLFCVKCIIK